MLNFGGVNTGMFNIPLGARSVQDILHQQYDLLLFGWVMLFCEFGVGSLISFGTFIKRLLQLVQWRREIPPRTPSVSMRKKRVHFPQPGYCSS